MFFVLQDRGHDKADRHHACRLISTHSRVATQAADDSLPALRRVRVLPPPLTCRLAGNFLTALRRGTVGADLPAFLPAESAERDGRRVLLGLGRFALGWGFVLLPRGE